MHSGKLWLIDDVELNLLNFNTTELLLMLLHSKDVGPHYKILVVWLPGTDMDGNILSFSVQQKEQRPEVHSQLMKASTLLQCSLLIPGTQEMINTYFLGTMIDKQMNECCQYPSLVNAANTCWKQMLVADEQQINHLS